MGDNRAVAVEGNDVKAGYSCLCPLRASIGGSSNRLSSFQTQQLDKLAQASYHDQGLVKSGMMQGHTASASKSPARPMTPVQGVVVTIMQAYQFAGLQRVSLLTDARRPKPEELGMGLLCPELLQPDT